MPTVNDPNGNPLTIGDHGFAHAYVASMELEAHSCDEGDCYSAVVEADTGGAACDFFYLKNTSEEVLRIYRIKGKAHTTDTQVQIVHGVSGEPTSPAEITPINALVGDGSLAQVSCAQRDGDMDLTGGAVYDNLFLDKDFLGEQCYDYSGEISLLKNQAIVFHAPLDTAGVVNMVIFFHFHNKVS